MSWRASRVENQWEELAFDVWCSLGEPEPPIDPFKICARLGLRVALSSQDRSLDSHFFGAERVVLLDRTRPASARYFAAAHEAMHCLFPGPQKERMISYVAMAVLLPRVHVADAMGATWDIAAHHDEFAPHLDIEVVARRLLSLQHDAAVTVWDDGEVTSVLRAPALRYSTPAAIESELAEQLFEDSGSTCFVLDERTRAVAVDLSTHRRVVTVVDRARLASEEPASAPAP